MREAFWQVDLAEGRSFRDVFEVMAKADHHVFQVLTKRHERLVELAPELVWAPNIWMGVSIENRRFVHRADFLREVPAAVRFVSAEPLLGNLRARHLVIGPSIEVSATGLRRSPTPLFEEEGDAFVGATVPQLADPVGIDASMAVAGLSADNEPVQTSQFELLER